MALKDWVSDLVKDQTTGKDGSFDVTKARKLAEVNGVDASKYATETGSERARLRMTVSNILRGKAKRRHGLKDIHGKFQPVPDDIASGLPVAVEDQNGAKVAKQPAQAAT